MRDGEMLAVGDYVHGHRAEKFMNEIYRDWYRVVSITGEQISLVDEDNEVVSGCLIASWVPHRRVGMCLYIQKDDPAREKIRLAVADPTWAGMRIHELEQQIAAQ